MNGFKSTFEYKIIYVFSIEDDNHKGLLKIGDATLKTDKTLDKLSPNSKDLNDSAKLRINSYTTTAGVTYSLLHTELALYEKHEDNGDVIVKAFRDHQVHRVLINSGISKAKVGKTSGNEWFKVDLETVKKAIECVKKMQHSFKPTSTNLSHTPIVFRPEQIEAIQTTIKRFKSSDKMLWNAKMRFGKTLSTLEVVKRMNFRKTIIITHRPVVNDGWLSDFNNVFYDCDNFQYISKNSNVSIKDLVDNLDNHFVYFASVQDLRGSVTVGGNFDKNSDVFDIDWDFVVVDEAHEGTQTSLGESVIDNIVKLENDYTTKFLALSGTPFNIIDSYDDNIYTWDYVMEQRAKENWYLENFGDSNPYEELPKLNIFTYSLGDIIGKSQYDELVDKAFNFKEFFRVWTGDFESDSSQNLPRETNVGDFYHKQDIESFLDLITKEDDKTNYPYSNNEYRELFKHSLWMLPGVKEAKALSSLLKSHPVFGSGAFEIINVAGEGDEESKSVESLTKVKSGIKSANVNNTYTITLSCGKLTTGVTIPEWTAVLMLSGSFSTSASNYLQTIFRVQSPCNIDGKIKSNCYVFDFAPDRTLKMLADSVKISTKAGKTKDSDRVIMGDFLNYCPVISVSGTQMKEYNVNNLLQQLKRAYAERVINNGFDDVNLYNDELLKLTNVEIEKFDELSKIVKSSKQAKEGKDLEINNQGFTDEEYEEHENISNKKKAERTPEEEERLKELKSKREQKEKAISNLRAISIRIPLLIYGAEVDFDKDLTIDSLLDDNIFDQSSWEEFMPKNLTKELFKEFIKYYDNDVFVQASQTLRNRVKMADDLSPTERIKEIAKIFSNFKNPDKETVLTPWRVVNMHMSDCLGGYSFYDDEFKELLDEPRFENRNQVTEDVFKNPNTKILEINSKTGLYPLYVTYSVFREKCGDITLLSEKEQHNIWNDTVAKNIFIICKTPMAKSITKRTLLGYNNNTTINAHYFDDLINMLKNKPTQFVKRISSCNYWNKGENGKMKFDAVVGNPPYQEEGENSRKSPIYHLFYNASFELSNISSLITPARFLFNAGQTPKEWNEKMLEDSHFKVINYFNNSRDVFPTAEIKGGIAITLRNSNYNFGAINIFTQNTEIDTILSKVKTNDNENLSNIIVGAVPYKFTNVLKSSRPELVELAGKSFDLRTNVFDKLSGEIFFENKPNDTNKYVQIFGLENKKRVYRWINIDYLSVAKNFNNYKVFLPKATGKGTLGELLPAPVIANPNVGHTQSFISIGDFDNEKEAENLSKYIKTKFCRLLLNILKTTPDITPYKWKYVPLQDFTKDSDIDWTKTIPEIDKQLYTKYKLKKEEKDFIERTMKAMF